MTALDPTAWFHYFSEDQLVLVSPALANLDAPDRDVYSASALARPALGLLPPHVRYILAKDESLRLEFVMNAHSDNAEKHAPVPVLPPESLCPTANELAILDSEREALAGQSLSGEALADWISECEETSAATASVAERQRDAIDSIVRITEANPLLAGSFVADSLAPWGVFHLEDDEIITVEASAEGSLLRFDRTLDLTLPADAQTPAKLLEWLLRINTASVIGPRCSIEMEIDTGLALLGLNLVPEALDATLLQDALSELDARARSIEACWISMQAPLVEDRETTPAFDWIKA